MDADSVFSMIRREANNRGYKFEKTDTKLGARRGFELTKGDRKIYGNVLGSQMREAQQYQGITESLHAFYSGRENSSFYVHVDEVANHFIVLSYSTLEQGFYPRDNSQRTNWNFHIKRHSDNHYVLLKYGGGEIDVSENIDTLNLLFQDMEENISVTNTQSFQREPLVGQIFTNEEMSRLEGSTGRLQQGMNFRYRGGTSLILMSSRHDAPYDDIVESDGNRIVYQGHNAREGSIPGDPKTVDQPRYNKDDSPTQNGKFYESAVAYMEGKAAPEKVKVYEKLDENRWLYRGIYELESAAIVESGKRQVFKFQLVKPVILVPVAKSASPGPKITKPPFTDNIRKIQTTNRTTDIGYERRTLKLLESLIADESLNPETRERAKKEYERAARDAKFRRDVLLVYSYKCAICGIQLNLVQAAHIVPVHEGGNDLVTNGIAMCQLHHKAFDDRLFDINEQFEMVPNTDIADSLKNRRLDWGLTDFVDFLIKKKKISLPEDSRLWPKAEYLKKRLSLAK